MSRRFAVVGLVASGLVALFAAAPVLAQSGGGQPGGQPEVQPGSIKVKVKDSAGNDVAGATVQLVRNGQVVRTAQTNAQGIVEWANVRPGPVIIRAFKQGVGGARAMGLVRPGQQLLRGLGLRQPPAAGPGGGGK